MSPDIIGRRFPSVAGRALSGEVVHVPEDLAGAPALLLCAYRRGTQDDVDLWAAFAGQRLPYLAVYELPIISSRVWRPLRGWIDGGMRGGVPPDLWTHVVTLYDDGTRARRSSATAAAPHAGRAARRRRGGRVHGLRRLQ